MINEYIDEEQDGKGSFEYSEDNVLPPENIVVLNELRSAADLNRLMTDVNSFDIQPDFQREEVWPESSRARFVDSLSKEFPIPSMCFALDPKEQKFIVIDGRQRMSTIKKFLTDNEWRLPILEDISIKISGYKVSEIRKESPELYRKIQNVSLPITILRYDPRKADNMEYIFTIFQRLNSLGEHLNNQEIRNAIFQGPFNTFIKEAARHPVWNEVFGSKSARMVNEERVLRFFAFYEDENEYAGKLIGFLNSYMQKKRFEEAESHLQQVFENVLEISQRVDSQRINKSNALRDAFLYGVSKNISYLSKLSNERISDLLAELERNTLFSTDELSGAIMVKKKVDARLKVAKDIFSNKG